MAALCECAPATGASSSRSARHSPTARSRSSPPTAGRSSRCGASPTRFAPSSCTITRGSGSRWCSCPAVNTPQFDWCRTSSPTPPAGGADLPARGPRGGRLLGCAPPPPGAHRRLRAHSSDRRQHALTRVRRLVPRAHGFARPADPGHAGRWASGPDNLFEPLPDLAATHGGFDELPLGGIPSSGRRRTVRCSAAGGSRRRVAAGGPRPPVSRAGARAAELAGGALRPARVRAPRRRRARDPGRAPRRARLDVLSRLGQRGRVLLADRRERLLCGHAG